MGVFAEKRVSEWLAEWQSAYPELTGYERFIGDDRMITRLEFFESLVFLHSKVKAKERSRHGDV